MFILMACFGGCGYYRRRHVLLQRHGGRPTTVIIAGTTTVSNHDVFAPPPPPVPVAPTGVFPAPPPYSEVSSKPNLYPKAEGAMPVSVPAYSNTVQVPPPYEAAIEQSGFTSGSQTAESYTSDSAAVS